MARAFELAITPIVFGAIGYALDGWLGTAPAFMLVLGVVTLIYLLWKNFAGYAAAMKVHEERMGLRPRK